MFQISLTMGQLNSATPRSYTCNTKNSCHFEREIKTHGKRLFKVVVLLQESGVVDDHLRRGHLEINHTVVRRLG